MMDIIEKHLSKLCCKHCKMFADNKCGGDDKCYHEEEKEIMVEIAMDKFNKSGDGYMKHWAENINDYYVCEDFEEKIDII